jgi:hypothetical protein
VQDAKISLMRSSPGQNLQTGAKFFLIASYTGTTGFAQEGVKITGTQDLRCIPYLAARLSIAGSYQLPAAAYMDPATCLLLTLCCQVRKYMYDVILLVVHCMLGLMSSTFGFCSYSA